MLAGDATLVFNELSYHPVGDDVAHEWIELHNQMSVDVDISAWRLSGGIDFEFPAQTIISGGGYLLVTADPTAFETATGLTSDFGPYTGRLSNSGEKIELFSHNDRLMNEITYRDDGDWPVAPDGSGVTLSKLDQDTGSEPSENWGFSAQVGGTPGEDNFPLPEPPVISGLMGLYQFDGDYLDSGAAGNHATVTGSVPFTGSGYEGQAVSFSGNRNNFLRVAIDTSPQNSDTVTWGAWVKSTNPGGNINTIFSNDNGGWDRFLFHDSGQWAVSRGSGIAHSGVNATTNWTFVAVTFDGATQRLYVDSDTPVMTTTDPGGSSQIYTEIGRNADGNSICGWEGLIDNAFIFDKALTSTQIGQIRAGGADAVLALAEDNPPPDDEEVPERPQLALNEISAAGSSPFNLEIVNYSDESIDLEGLVLASSDPAAVEYTFAAQSLGSGEMLVLDDITLGFTPVAGNRLFLYTADKAAVIDAARIENRLIGRLPEAMGRWLYPDVETPGQPNQFDFQDQVVINEIMYHAYPQQEPQYAESEEEWIELYNNGATSVDMTGWSLEGGVTYDFPVGESIGPGQYLVVARNAFAMAVDYPGIDISGSYNGRLANGGEEILLIDSNGNPADELHYYDSGAWPAVADGGGSSLELIDPDSDNGASEAWASSDETDRSSWNTYTYRGTATEDGIGYNIWHEFVFGLLNDGEMLLDDIQVIEDPDGSAQDLLQNGNFEADALDAAPAKWRAIGNHGGHGQTVVIQDPDDPANQVLHVVATGATEHEHNHVETTFAGGATVSAGEVYEISFRAKWLGGSNQLNTRLYFNWLQETTLIDVPAHGGTPGAENSVYQENAGPTYSDFQHTPTVPKVNEAVTVSVVAEDPDGIASMTLFYSVNGSSMSSVPMSLQSDGLYKGIVPGQASGAVVQFFVRGEDIPGQQSEYPSEGADSRALFVVHDGRANYSSQHSVRVIMTPADTSYLYEGTNRLSNDQMGATVVYDERIVYYNVGVRLKGSPYRRNQNSIVSLNVQFPPDNLFRGEHESIVLSRGPAKEILAKHLFNAAGGELGNMYEDVAYLVAPRSQDDEIVIVGTARYGDAFFESQYGGTGTLYNLELLYTPTTTTGGTESLKLNYPYSHTNGSVDIENLGDDEEAYRWNFQIREGRDRDDFAPMIAVAKAFDLTGQQLDEQTQQLLDVDQWMRTFAMLSLAGNDDVYTRLWNHNFRMFQRPEDGRMVALPWDLDRAFQLSTNAPLWGDENMQKVIELPANKRVFYGHVQDMINTTYNTAYMSHWTNHYGSLTGDNFSGVLNYIGSRGSYSTNQLPSAVPFAITTNGGGDFSVSEPSVTLQGNGWINVREIYLDGATEPLDVTWTDEDSWQVTIPLAYGANDLNLQTYDFQGNALSSDSLTVTSTVSSRPQQELLCISEINYHPTNPTAAELVLGYDDEDFEFVEIHNISATQEVDLTGVQFTDGITFTFPASTLAAGDHVIVVRNQAAFEARYGTGVNIVGQYSGKFSDGGEQVVMADQHGAEILNFFYSDEGSWPGRADGDGSTLELKDPSSMPFAGVQRTAFMESGNNWRSSSEYSGTPGAEGSGPDNRIVVNEVLSHTDTTLVDMIEIYNTTDQPIDIGGWYLSDQAGVSEGFEQLKKYQISAGTTIDPYEYLFYTEYQFNPTGGADPTDFALNGAHGDDVYLSEVDGSGAILGFVDHVDFGAAVNGESFGRWPDGQGGLYPMANFTVGSKNTGPRLPDSVVISEVHYHSIEQLGVDDLEFIEIYNPTGSEVELENWRIRGGVDYDFDPTATIGAGETLVILSFDPDQPENNARVTAFRTAHGIDTSVELIGGYSGKLDNGGDRVQLQRPDAPPADEPDFIPHLYEDEVDYDDAAPWPVSADGLGDSLTRVWADRWGNYSTTWTATKPTPGSFQFNVPLVADLDGDGAVEADDLSVLLSGFGTPSGVLPGYGDVDLDGDIDANDLNVLLNNFGHTWSPEQEAIPIGPTPEESPSSEDTFVGPLIDSTQKASDHMMERRKPGSLVTATFARHSTTPFQTRARLHDEAVATTTQFARRSFWWHETVHKRKERSRWSDEVDRLFQADKPDDFFSDLET